MSVQTKAGSFVNRTGTGTQAVVGVGFEPKALIFWTEMTSALFTQSDEGILCIGFDDGTTHCGRSIDVADPATSYPGPATHSSTFGYRNAHSIVRINSDDPTSPSTDHEAHITSMDSDGFTLSWATNNLTNRVIHYLAIGGATVSVKVGHGAAPGATGNQAITGVGFTPTAVLFVHGPGASDAAQNSGPGAIGIGFMDANGNQGLSSVFWGQLTGSPSTAAFYQRTDRCLGFAASTSTVIEAHAVSMDVDGFTISWDATSAGKPFFYLAIGGVPCLAGSFTQPTSTGPQTVPSGGLNLSAILLLSANGVASSSLHPATASLSLGAADASVATCAAPVPQSSWTGFEQGTTPYVTARARSTTALLQSFTPQATGSANTLNTAAALTGIGTASGFSLQWATVDATARQILFFGLGGGTPVAGASVSYEDPCSMKSAFPFIVIKARDKMYAATSQYRPLNDDGDYYGGKKIASVLDFGAPKREASDVFTGQWVAQQQRVLIDDVLGIWRGRRSARGGDLVRAQAWSYVVSDIQRRAKGPARLAFEGLVSANPLPPSRQMALTILDEIGNAWKLGTPDVQIPQRTINDTIDFAIGPSSGHFPGFDNKDRVAVPICFGLSGAGGLVPAIPLGDFVCADAVTRQVGLLYGHATKDGVIEAYQDGSLITSWGTDIWAPGQSGWATVNPSGASLFTDLTNALAGTWRYTLCFVGGSRADDFASGSKPITFNVKGPDSTADGLGVEMTDAHELAKWYWLQWLLPTPCYLTGSWLSSPTFEFFPGGDVICRLLTSSFADAADVAGTYVGGGFKWAGLVGANGRQIDRRDAIAQSNLSGYVRAAMNGFGQIFVRMLDRRRSEFLRGQGTISDRREITVDPAWSLDERHDWHATNLTVRYGLNPRTGDWDGRVQLGSDPDPFLDYGSIDKTIDLPYVQDPATATAICQQMLDFMQILPQQATFGRTRCGYRHDPLDAIPITHRGGNGVSGCTDHVFWIDAREDPLDRNQTNFRATDVDRLLE